MPLFDECCVLIPASTLEDFPSGLSDYDARSLLAAWTVLWHPCLLAESGQLPVWYRADSPPESVDRRLIAVPKPSLSRLPDGFSVRAENCPSCCWISGESRAEMLSQLPLDKLQSGPPQGIACGPRIIEIADFFAVGYAVLQIQVMTRRLRYTSNIDEIHLQNRVIAAAQAFVDGDASVASQALHDVFDCLAEERDHYFSSDPHLVDLNLTSRSTIDRLLEMVDSHSTSGLAAKATAKDSNASLSSDEVPGDDRAPQASGMPEPDSVLATPFNLLIDGEVAAAIGELADARTNELKRQLSSGAIGWAGGGPPTSVCLDAMTYAQAEAVFEQAYQLTADALGTAPPVYGRFSGATPSDMTATLVRLGYCGMIPIDFAGGSGFGDEAKVILQSAGAQLEALTAKPIDASSDASFLTLGTRLGEAIDSGEIATALLVHWPGESCDAFVDLKRVASWSLCLGRFWNLADYFRDGEHPYHHGTTNTSSPQSAELLTTLVTNETVNPISELAASFRKSVIDEQQAIFAGMRDLITGDCAAVRGGGDPSDPSEGLAAAIGAPVCGKEAKTKSTLVINSHSVGCRHGVSVAGSLPPKSDHLYAATIDGGQVVATVDVPACGFVLLRGGQSNAEGGIGLVSRLRQKLFGGPQPIAETARLQNEFMELTLNVESGGVSGVYSGGTRGNRFSLRLVRAGLENDPTSMHCDQMRIISSSPSIGCIETVGTIRATKESGDPVLASYRMRYTLERGSRFLQIDGEIEPKAPIQGAPWNHYFAAQAAFASESPICRVLIRDKSHRAKSRRMVAPLGVVIDEADRQTLICGQGLAFHRRVDERFVDTPILVQGERCSKFTLHYGFDVPSPVAMARSRMAPPVDLQVQPAPGTPEVSWMMHASPKDLLVSQLAVHPCSDGSLSAFIRVIQTQPQACKAKLRFFRNVTSAVVVDGPLESFLNRSQEELESVRSGQRIDLKHDGDRVTLSMPSHGVADLLVVFAQPNSND